MLNKIGYSSSLLPMQECGISPILKTRMSGFKEIRITCHMCWVLRAAS